MSRGSGLLDIFVKSTVAGAGLSLGHDAYRQVKKSAGLILLCAVFAGTAVAAWDLTRPHQRGPVTSVILMICDGLLILMSLGMSLAIGASAGAGGVVVALVFQLVLFLTGARLGGRHRSEHRQQSEIENYNTMFMRENGLRQVGGRYGTLVDMDGNELVLDDTRLDALVFKVAGRRGARAKIQLDGNGRMVTYTGP